MSSEEKYKLIGFVLYMILESWLGKTSVVRSNSLLELLTTDIIYAIKMLWAMVVRKLKGDKNV